MERLNRCAHTRAIAQTRVDDGRGIVDASSHIGDNAIDDHAQVRLIFEPLRRSRDE
jgi:hypothetical protein